jgi:1-acyl-sn-glycerol-3-phosphate acyltransferase
MPASSRALTVIRSAVFLPLFYLTLAVFLIGGIWLLVSPRRWAMAGLAAHGRATLWLLRVVCGTRLEIRGKENLPPPPILVASKHQSAWDTFALVTMMRDPALIMKSELLSVPVYGWFCKKFGMIPIQRELGPSALRTMAREAKERAAAGREVVIFPEGTRRPPLSPPAYKPGLALLYQQLGLPVCPVGLNSGVFWPRGSFLRYPGTIVVEFLPVIPAGLKREEFQRLLESRIEESSTRLAREASRVREMA